MSSCPHCGRESTSSTPPCSQCPDKNLPMASEPMNKTYTHNAEVIEPEIVLADDSQQNNKQWSQENSQQQHGNFRFTTWTFGQQGNVFAGAAQSASCLPGIITLSIAIFLGINFGLLASLGFFVFYAIGSALSFIITLQRAMRAQQTNTWINRALVWIISTAITIGLAGGF